jgi:oligopeptide/dipeptide ABC transporter ATP-binding protein
MTVMSPSADGLRADEALRIENLRISFSSSGRKVSVVDGIDLTVARGTVLGLVGESGSGKSVTAMAILGLVGTSGSVDPASRIYFEGRDLTKLDDHQMRGLRGDRISMIFQEPMSSLNPVMRVGDQIAETARLHLNMPRKQARQLAVELLGQVGIAEPANRARDYPYQLSGGMCQRVMIAMALVCRPSLLIADEPTTALDITIQAQILRLLADLRADSEMSMVLITHDLGVIADTAGELAVMYAGKIVEQGPTAQVLTAPRHPYTRALIRSMPRLAAGGERLSSIPGAVPTPGRWPAGCRFAPRCEFAFDQCGEEPPLFRSGSRSSACWLDRPALAGPAPADPRPAGAA